MLKFTDVTKLDHIQKKSHVEIIDIDDGQKYSGYVEKIMSFSDDPNGIQVILRNGREGHIIKIINSDEDVLSRILQESNDSDNKLDFLADDMKEIAIPQVIQSFLNAEGGWVYLGILDDAKTIEEKLVGLESEKKKMEETHDELTWGKFEDLYCTQIMAALESKLSSEAKFGNLVDPKLRDLNGVKIFEIQILPSPSPVFYKYLNRKKKEIEFHIKINENSNTDRRLDEFHYRDGSGKKDCQTGEELYFYMKKRFFNSR